MTGPSRPPSPGATAPWRPAILLAVALGAAAGGVLRALASWAALAAFGPGFPWGTLAVNVAGSLAIGFWATLAGPDGRLKAGHAARAFVTTGFCGGFTTFSVFSLETLRLLQAGRVQMAAASVALSVSAWLGAVWLGHLLAVRVNRHGRR